MHRSYVFLIFANKDFCVYIAIYISPRCNSYILLVREFWTSKMLDEWSPTSKLLATKLSQILDNWYIFFTCMRTHLSAITFFWYFQFFSSVFYDWVLSTEYYVNFTDLGVTLGLSTFCIIFPTFFQTSISPDFTWIFIDRVSAGFFPGVFSPWPEKKRHREKSPQKNIPTNSVKNIRPYRLLREDSIFANPITPSENRMTRINSYLWQIFPYVLHLGENCSDLILDFLYFYDDIFLLNFE